MRAALVALALLQTEASAATAGEPLEQSAGPVRELREDEMLFVALSLDRITLADNLVAYGDPADPMLPVGELARLLDLDLTVVPQEHSIVGTLGEDRRAVTVDFDLPLVRVGGRDLPFASAEVGYTATEIFIRANALEAILPVRFVIDGEALAVDIAPLEKLPIQAR